MDTCSLHSTGPCQLEQLFIDQQLSFSCCKIFFFCFFVLVFFFFAIKYSTSMFSVPWLLTVPGYVSDVCKDTFFLPDTIYIYLYSISSVSLLTVNKKTSSPQVGFYNNNFRLEDQF